MPSQQYEDLWADLQPKLDAFRDCIEIDDFRTAIEALYEATGDLEPAEFERATVGGVDGLWVTTPESRADHVVLYMHGGGFALGSAHSHRDMIARFASAAGARAFGIDYRQPPGDPFPAALEDCVAAWEGLLGDGVDPGKAVICGDSAGGGLATSTLVAIRERGLSQPGAAVLFSPWVDLTQSGDSIRGNEEIDPMTTPEVLYNMSATYHGGVEHSSCSDWRCCPVLNADLEGLPRMLIQVGENEILFDDSRRLADKARGAGVDVELQVFPGMFHVFQLYADRLDEGKEAFANVRRFLRG